MAHEGKLMDTSFYLFQNRVQARLLILGGPYKQMALNSGRLHAFIHSKSFYMSKQMEELPLDGITAFFRYIEPILEQHFPHENIFAESLCNP